MNKRVKKLTMTAIAALSAAVMATGCSTSTLASMMPGMHEVYELEKTDIKVVVSADGKVESKNTVNIYTTLNFPVKEVKVKLGDRVKAGDVLCVLDSADLEAQIAVQEAYLHNSNSNAYFAASESEKAYNEALFNYENGLNIELNGAETALKNAEMELNDLRKQYNNRKENSIDESTEDLVNAKVAVKNAGITVRAELKKYQDEMKEAPLQADIIAKYDTTYKNAKARLKQAKTEFKNAQGGNADILADKAEALDKAQEKYDDAYDKLMDAYTDSNCKYARMAYEFALDNEEQAQERLDNISYSANMDMSQLAKLVNSAELNYNNAQKTYDSTKASIEKRLETMKVTMNKDKDMVANQPNTIEVLNMKTKLENCTIRATSSGVVTTVNAHEGMMAGGVLFTIQDDKNLQIDADIKENDFSKISESMPAIVKSFVTDNKEFKGAVSHISPVAEQGVTGNVFPIIIDINESGMLIGTDARIKIVSAQKEDVYAVTFDSITENKDGKDVVFIAEPQGKKGMYKAKEVVVETGLETDYEIEVSAEELTDGVLILSNVENLEDGSVVNAEK